MHFLKALVTFLTLRRLEIVHLDLAANFRHNGSRSLQQMAALHQGQNLWIPAALAAIHVGETMTRVEDHTEGGP